MMIPLSFWEQSFFTQIFDLAIVGAGFVGLSAALEYKRINPDAKIIILEKGLIGQGASTKNAGFSCFGSIGELEDDLLSNSIESVIDTVKMRWEGLKILRANVPDVEMDYLQTGGWEVFDDLESYELAAVEIGKWNALLTSIIGETVFQSKELRKMNFYEKGIFNPYEGQLNPMKAIQFLYKKVISQGIVVVRGVDVQEWHMTNKTYEITAKSTNDFRSKKLLVATNGFTRRLLSELDVRPARNQVLITKPLEELSTYGNFHFMKGYIYFRHVNNRILLGGARFLSDQEYTDEYGETKQIQEYLLEILRQRIMIDHTFEIEQSWSGILGVGNGKGPIIKELSSGLFVAVRLGGMGVAIGMGVGHEAARQISASD